MNSDAIYCSLGEYERHFNNIQAGFRAVASTWLLATFAAVGLILRPDKDAPFLLSASSLVVGASLLGTVGLVLLWMIDQRVYQRLLGAVLVAAICMETQEPRLPKVRALMIHRFGGKGAARSIAWFYAVPVFILAVLPFLAAAAGSDLTRAEQWLLWLGVVVEVILGVCIVVLGGGQSTGKFVAELQSESEVADIVTKHQARRDHLKKWFRERPA